MTARRILICLHDFHRGGTERVAIGLARNWVEAGRDVTILCGDVGGGLRDSVDPSVLVVALNPPVKRAWLSRFRLGRQMGKQIAGLRPDVIFLPGNFHLLLANALHAADNHAAIALKVSNPPLPIAPRLAAPIFRHLARGVDGFAAMNSGLARELAALLPGRNIVSLHDPVYSRRATENPSRKGPRKIVWIGRLEPQKDPGLALQALEALTDVHLIMLGDGALRDSVLKQIKALGLGDRVRLLGDVPYVGSYLADADALLVTSRYEGGPAVAVEALAQGTPVVSTDCSHLLRELITPQAGRLVSTRAPLELAAALQSVFDAAREPATLRALAGPFAPELRAQAYLDWFDSLVRQ
jgi:glycosyltransferase involved in cell wall biosynthesis